MWCPHKNFGPPGCPDEEYHDTTWDSLPDQVRKAYEVLGWTKELWANDGSVGTDVLDWVDLTDKEREAAGVLGYTEVTWDTCEPAPSSTTE